MSDSVIPWTIQSMEFSGQNTGVCSLSLLQGVFPTQGLNPGLLHCRRILYQLSSQGNQRIPEWVANPFCCGSSQPRNEPGSPALHVDSLPSELSIYLSMGFPGGSAGEGSACNAGDLGSIPGLGRPPGEGKGYLLQCSGLRIPWTV